MALGSFNHGKSPTSVIFHFQDYHFHSSIGKNVIFLSDEEQLKMKNSFVQNVPWHSFGRKNIGYLFAIANGAKVIWDFDDDNILKFWMKGAVATDGLLEIDQFANQDALKSKLFWPRMPAIITSSSIFRHFSSPATIGW